MKNQTLSILLFFFSITVVLSCKSSYTHIGDKNANYIPYYLKVYEADSLFLVNNFEGSYKILDSLFKKYEPVNLDIYEEYLTYTILKNKLKIEIEKKEISSLISDYGYTFNRLNDNNLFTNFKNYSKKRKKYLAKLNFALRDTIVSMKRNDQKYRGNNFDKNINNQKILDSLNTEKLKKIFEIYNYPDKDVIGNDVLDYNNESKQPQNIVSLDVLTILLHTNKKERNDYFLPKMKIFLTKGIANPLVYARVYDQSLLYDYQNQFYGSYENEINEAELLKINQNRKEIGLPSYGYEKWRRKIKYPELF